MSSRQNVHRSVGNRRISLGKKEGFWPFDDWNPYPDPGPGKSGPEDPTGVESSRASIKNYPSVTGRATPEEQARKRRSIRKQRVRR